MIDRAYYEQSTDRYDYAINGVPFLSAASADAPYNRDTADWLRDSLDVTAARGEQSLGGWWYRSQRSFHLGAGITYFDPTTTDDVEVAYKFADSSGVDVWTPGEVTLLHDTSTVRTIDADEDKPSLAVYQIGGPGLPVTTFEDGVLLGDKDVLRKVKRDGTSVVIDFGGTTGTNIYDVSVSGGIYYVAALDGLYSGSIYDWITDATPGIKIYDDDLGADFVSVMGWVKDRFMLGRKNKLYELPIDGSPVADPLPTPLYTHSLPGWSWTGFASGPDCIYASGWRGPMSRIYATTLETSEAGATPTLSQPYVVVDMPWDERVWCMTAYMGTYLILGTDLGIRVCIIGSDGQITLGPLSVETDTPVKALFCSGKFCWFSGGNKDSKRGLYRLDLSSPTQNLVFPWARDICESATGGSVITAVSEVGQSGRMAFATANGLLTFEDESNRVASGYLDTGKIRYNTWEKKVFQFLRVNVTGTAGDARVYWSGDDSTYTLIEGFNAGTVLDTDAGDGLAHQWVSYRFMLRTDAGLTANPALRGYQVRANPSAVKPRAIRLALMCSLNETPPFGRRVTRGTWDRITGLEAAEHSGECVWLQDFGTGEERLVIVDRVQFVQQYIPEQPSERSDPSGVLLVTLRTVD